MDVPSSVTPETAVDPPLWKKDHKNHRKEEEEEEVDNCTVCSSSSHATVKRSNVTGNLVRVAHTHRTMADSILDNKSNGATLNDSNNDRNSNSNNHDPNNNQFGGLHAYLQAQSFSHVSRQTFLEANISNNTVLRLVATEARNQVHGLEHTSPEAVARQIQSWAGNPAADAVEAQNQSIGQPQNNDAVAGQSGAELQNQPDPKQSLPVAGRHEAEPQSQSIGQTQNNDAVAGTDPEQNSSCNSSITSSASRSHNNEQGVVSGAGYSILLQGVSNVVPRAGAAAAPAPSAKNAPSVDLGLGSFSQGNSGVIPGSLKTWVEVQPPPDNNSGQPAPDFPGFPSAGDSLPTLPSYHNNSSGSHQANAAAAASDQPDLHPVAAAALAAAAAQAAPEVPDRSDRRIVIHSDASSMQESGHTLASAQDLEPLDEKTLSGNHISPPRAPRSMPPQERAQKRAKGQECEEASNPNGQDSDSSGDKKPAAKKG